MLLQQSRIVLTIVLVVAAHAVLTAASAHCLKYRRYSFKPICLDPAKSLKTANEIDCAIAASMLDAGISIAVTSSNGDPCRVTDALCPRYELCFTDCAVLMPVSMVNTLEHLVMSVKSGCGHKVLKVLTNPDPPQPDYVIQPAHPDAAILPDTFRSALLDDIPRLISSLTHKQFIVQLYKNSEVVVRLVFDVGTNSASVDITNWFAKNRLSESWPITDIASRDTNKFSIAGDNSEQVSRHFFINYFYGHCPGDTGFVAVLDMSDGCSHWSFTDPIPKIVYNTKPDQPWSTSSMYADYIAVLVR